ncbi:DNA methyltransferase [Bacillus spizizenii]|nr:modification methylase [Bacillus spizizenii]MEC0588239.1 DNA methyltransferase [Bacillus spizizenii]
MKSRLQEKLNSYGENFWDFVNIKRDGIHKLANYPAMMVAPMQQRLIEDICLNENNISNIFDPFHGSGTTLVEGKRLNLDLIGIDINPLANLITKVKIEGVNLNTIPNSIKEVVNNIRNLSESKVEPFSFDKIDKWFRKDIIRDLTILRKSIILEKDDKNRLYFWVCLSDIIRKYSNTRSSTYKLHIKEKEKILNMENRVIEDFIYSISINYEYLEPADKINYEIIQGDSLIEMKKMNSESIDLICTSPPYGDNGTTVTYGQFSILSLFWIDKKDINLSDNILLSNYSAIDSSSLGGKKRYLAIDSYLPLLSNTISKITLKKQSKVISFFDDYFKSLDEMIRVLKKDHLIILTLGNRRVDNVEIKLDEITKEYCLENGMSLEAKLKREIPRKRMPRKISRIKNHGAVSSMNKETVLILRKKGE